MKKYGDVKLIKKRIRYLKKLYHHCQNPVELKKIQSSLMTNMRLLYCNEYLFDFLSDVGIGRILKECCILTRELKYKRINKGVMQPEPYMNANELSLLMTLANYVADGELRGPIVSSNISFDRDAVVNGAKWFFDSLEDEEISMLSEKILTDPSSIYFFGHRQGNNFIASHFFDHVFHKPYICVLESHDFRDLFTLIRECTLGIQFYMKDDFGYNFFQDACAYVMEELAFSYFETTGINREDIACLKRQRESMFTAFANDTLMEIHSLPGQQNLKSFFHPNMDEILKVIPRRLKQNLIQIQSYVMACALVQQIKIDRKIGLEHLKVLMHMDMVNHQRSSLEKIGLGDDALVVCAREIAMRGKKVYHDDNEKKRC